MEIDSHVRLSCKVFASAFSGEAVFAVGDYEGVAPLRYVEPSDRDVLSQNNPVDGTVRVTLLGTTEDGKSKVSTPDGEKLEVSSRLIVETTHVNG